MGIPPEEVLKFQITNPTNIIMISELDRLIDGLNKAGIEVISLKGATASEKIFGDIGLYPSGDIDILVKVEGYRQSSGIP